MSDVGVAVWRIATDTPGYEAVDLSGKGTELNGGRWNRPGRAVVYASSTIALACLETVVHLNQSGLLLNRFLVRIDIPATVWAARRVQSAADLAIGWTAIPEGKVSLDVGDAWLRAADTAILILPALIVPEESNVLINPSHPDAASIRASKLRTWFYDARVG